VTEECSLCFDVINSNDEFYEITWGIGRVCEICLTFFNLEKIEKMVHVFSVARGRFGFFEEQIPLIKDILKDYAYKLRTEALIDINDLYNRIATTAKKLGLKSLF